VFALQRIRGSTGPGRTVGCRAENGRAGKKKKEKTQKIKPFLRRPGGAIGQALAIATALTPARSSPKSRSSRGDRPYRLDAGLTAVGETTDRPEAHGGSASTTLDEVRTNAQHENPSAWIASVLSSLGLTTSSPNGQVRGPPRWWEDRGHKMCGGQEKLRKRHGRPSGRR